ncbi:MAG TPA: DMT family transporter, partial [Zoogloea sp.]|nr:DMT family transporter [Zoogloea sp.]
DSATGAAIEIDARNTEHTAPLRMTEVLPGQHFVRALRDLGAARTGAYFSTAPFVGAALSIALLGEPTPPPFWLAVILMGVGVWLHLTEHHEHAHEHAALSHTHAHVHDEHHQHEHDFPWDGREPHDHPHAHTPMRHFHPHYPDIHHRHRH